MMVKHRRTWPRFPAASVLAGARRASTLDSYVGTHPTGRRYYTKSKSGAPLAFAVFARDTRIEPAKWERVALVEDRPYKDQFHRVNGCYVSYEGDMPPRVKAEESATWFREVIRNHETRIVDLRLVGSPSDRETEGM